MMGDGELDLKPSSRSAVGLRLLSRFTRVKREDLGRGEERVEGSGERRATACRARIGVGTNARFGGFIHPSQQSKRHETPCYSILYEAAKRET